MGTFTLPDSDCTTITGALPDAKEGYEYDLQSLRTLPALFTDRPGRTGRVINSPALPCHPLYLRLIRFHSRQQCQIEKKTLSGAQAGVTRFECVAAKQFLQLLEY